MYLVTASSAFLHKPAYSKDRKKGQCPAILRRSTVFVEQRLIDTTTTLVMAVPKRGDLEMQQEWQTNDCSPLLENCA